MDDMQSGYKDRDTGLFYVGDGTYTDGGENLRASSEYEGIYQRPFLTVRSFPSGERNCYALPTEAGARYLVRFRIYYGNHDGKNNSRLTRFDLHIGANYWDTTDASSYTPWYEAVFMAWASWAPVCLVNTGSGVPFVSTLELRLLGDTLYPAVTASEWMAMYYRANMGSNIDLTRFPSDGYDRFWWQTNFPEWASKSTTETIKEDPSFAEPLVVLQSAATPIGNDTTTLNYWWQERKHASLFKVFLHFADFQNTQTRQFDIYFNGNQLNEKPDLSNSSLHGALSKSFTLLSALENLYDSDGLMCDKIVNTSKNRAVVIAISVVVPVLVVVVLLVAYFIWLEKGKPNALLDPARESKLQNALGSGKGHGDYLKSEYRLFTYKELKKLTNNFKQVQSLSKVHHRNLVSLVGYCWEKGHLALVYEYMSQGNLCDRLRGKNGVAEALNWETRLRIVLEAAQGLDYLHKGCIMPIVHRDLKTSNILLDNNLQAKIADFGLSKTYLSDTQTHISTTNLAGTAGYINPEYQTTGRLTKSCDVYSFGVVVLEVVTGQAPTRMGYGHIVQRVKKQIATGNISSVADARLGGAYDINSMWNVVETAIMCTQDSAAQRPTMSTVVVLLKESLALEEAREKGSSVRASPTTDTAALVSRVGSLAR
nr:unnamed protein product [Digitaria exilis]